MMGDFNTITGGFLGGGVIRTSWKCYSRAILSLETRMPKPMLAPTFYIWFTYLEDMFSQEGDLVVLTIVTMGGMHIGS